MKLKGRTAIVTGLLGHFLPAGDPEAGRQKVISTIPMGRLSRPIDIAKACAFLRVVAQFP